jgi:predicted anti-sigma-YlaC factor YlaD
MTLRDEHWRELARALLATCPDEIDCEQWLDRVGTYLDLVEAGRPVPESLLPVAAHLERCPECAEEFQAIREMLRNPG